ncbi:MAG TPA: DUF4276 family protein [Planctomycetota bacterium]|nr:DUF4276 family protein [Planctomycetota bacterium]
MEGGGEGMARAALREGFCVFLGELRDRARRKRMEWSVIPAGSRNDAYQAFRAACQQRPQIINVLLVDAEGVVVGSPKDHVCNSNRWERSVFTDDNCHLMVQLMESWFLADLPALSSFYGPDFREGQIPRTNDVEAIGKDRVLTALGEATRSTQQGQYSKTRHAPRLLKCIRHSQVLPRARHCERLFVTLRNLIEEA